MLNPLAGRAPYGRPFVPDACPVLPQRVTFGRGIKSDAPERFANFRFLLRCPSVGMVTKPSAEQTQDFSIHNEDFPALPGPNYKDTTLNNDESKTVSVSH